MSSLLTLSVWVILSFSSTIHLLFHLHNIPWIIAILVATIALFLIIWNKRKNSLVIMENKLPESRTDCREVVEFYRYTGGHPDINEAIIPCVVSMKPGSIQICRYANESRTQIACMGIIQTESVVEIRVEDVFTMKRKMTPEQWQVSHKYFDDLNDANGDEIAFIVIEWLLNEEHQFTYLCIRNSFAMEIAVKKRNAIIKKSRQESLQPA
jgi:hypothetical protein